MTAPLIVECKLRLGRSQPSGLPVSRQAHRVPRIARLLALAILMIRDLAQQRLTQLGQLGTQTPLGHVRQHFRIAFTADDGGAQPGN